MDGLFCKSDNLRSFQKCIENMNAADIEEMGMLARRYLSENYSVEIPYKKIMGE